MFLYLQEINGDNVIQAVELAVLMNENNDIGIPVTTYVEEAGIKVVKPILKYIE